MKQLLIKMVLLLLSINLVVSCSTNTQNQNTAVGAGAGAVVGGVAGSLISGGGGGAIAAGAIVGAIAGGLIGRSMDSVDKTHMDTTMDSAPTNKSVVWTNEKTGKQYKVTPTSNKMSYRGNSTCRSYKAISTMDGKNEQVKGVVCRQTDGTWVTVTP